MAKRIGRYVIELPNRPSLLAGAAAVGKTEREGPLKEEFDICYESDKICEGTWEQCESRLTSDAVSRALIKAGKVYADIDMIFAGDLLNQCVASAFFAKNTDIPFAGLFGACSTMALAMALAGLATDSGAADLAIAAASSHFCSAERQFRFPLEYGGQRPATAQRTVTGAGAVLFGKHLPGRPFVCAVMIGRIRDLGITDANNMGAAMAPAAACTIIDFLRDTGKKAEDFDQIVTGDLGMIGSHLLLDLLKERESVDLSTVHEDCGNLIFDPRTQDVHAGGSGCGCSASVISSYYYKRLCSGKIRNVLFVGTGALMSTTTAQQGSNIPGIAHAVWLCAPEES